MCTHDTDTTLQVALWKCSLDQININTLKLISNKFKVKINLFNNLNLIFLSVICYK